MPTARPAKGIHHAENLVQAGDAPPASWHVLPASTARANHALDKRVVSHGPVHERPVHLQCPPRPLLGQLVLRRASRSARDWLDGGAGKGWCPSPGHPAHWRA